MKLFFALTLFFTANFLYVNTATACQPAPAWVNTSLEIEAALSHGGLWKELGGGFPPSDITGIQKTGELTYKINVTRQNKNCSIDVVVTAEYEDSDLPCSPHYAPKFKSAGKLVCAE